MSSRYATGAALFWSAMLICCWSVSASARRPMGVGLRLVLAGASVVLVTAIIRVQAPGLSVLQDRAYGRNMIENALDLGLIDEALLTSLDEVPEQVREIAPFLRGRGISIFAGPDAHVLGRPLADAGPLEPNPCPGSFTAAESAPSLGADGVRVSGTSGLRPIVPTSGRVYLADPGGTVVGLASTPFGQPSWSGYATAARSERLRAFARLGSGRLCEVGTATVTGDPSPSADVHAP